MTKKVPECLPARVRAKGSVFTVLLVSLCWVSADQVDLHNGDRFIGKVVSLTDDKVVLESDALGTLKLPRAKVAAISFGGANDLRPAGSNQSSSGPISSNSTNAHRSMNPELSGALRGLGTNTLQQVRGQFLAGAGPEANNKFNELLGGLMNGTVTVRDIRVQAKSAADQIRALKQDLGDDSGWALNGYLAILEHFLSEPDPDGVRASNGTSTVPQAKAVKPSKPQAKAESVTDDDK